MASSLQPANPPAYPGLGIPLCSMRCCSQAVPPCFGVGVPVSCQLCLLPASAPTSWRVGTLSDSRTQLSWPCSWLKSSGNTPNPPISCFCAFPFSTSPFQGGVWGELWGVGLRQKEVGVLTERQTPCFQALGGGNLWGAASSAASLQEGVWEFLPTPPTDASCPTWLPAQNRAQQSQTGLCVPETKNNSSPQPRPRPVSALPWSWPQKGSCHFPGGDTGLLA